MKSSIEKVCPLHVTGVGVRLLPLLFIVIVVVIVIDIISTVRCS